jgi:hypothetical protein
LQRTYKTFRVVQEFSMGMGNIVRPGELLELVEEDQRTQRLVGIGRIVPSEAEEDDNLRDAVRDILRAPWTTVPPALRGMAKGDDALLLNAMQEAERQEMNDKNRPRLLTGLRNEIRRLGGNPLADQEVDREVGGVDPNEQGEGGDDEDDEDQE